MSHSITVTRTVTGSMNNSSFIVLHTGYLKSFPGILKLLQLLIGAAMVGIFSYYQTNGSCWIGVNGVIFAFLMSVTFLVGTFCLFLSCLVSVSIGSLVSQTSYEIIYHTIAGIMLLTCSIILLVSVSDRYRKHEAYFAASIMGLTNSILYFISAFLARRF